MGDPGQRFAGRRALVTGGASGIGRAVARRLASEGAAVCLLDVDGEAAAHAAAELGLAHVTADVADAGALAGGFAEATTALGGLDIVCNNAGVGNVKPIGRYRDEEWNQLIDVNLRGVFHGIRAAVAHLDGQGVIVNIASVSGLRPTRGEAPYSAAKAGVIALTMSAALELAPGVRVNCVSPGFIETPLTAYFASDAEAMAEIGAATPLARAGTADEVAAAVAFLCSDEASYITGQNLIVDGGSMLPSAQMDRLLGRITDLWR